MNRYQDQLLLILALSGCLVGFHAATYVSSLWTYTYQMQSKELSFSDVQCIKIPGLLIVFRKAIIPIFLEMFLFLHTYFIILYCC